MRFSRKRQDESAPILFFQGLGKTLDHYNLHWKATHPAFKSTRQKWCNCTLLFLKLLFDVHLITDPSKNDFRLKSETTHWKLTRYFNK